MFFHKSSHIPTTFAHSRPFPLLALTSLVLSPPHFRSTPSGSEYRICSTSGFAPLIPRGTGVPFKACFDSSRVVVLFSSSFFFFRVARSAAPPPLHYLRSLRVARSARSALLILRSFVRPLQGRNMRYALPRDSLTLIPRGTDVPFKACFDSSRVVVQVSPSTAPLASPGLGVPGATHQRLAKAGRAVIHRLRYADRHHQLGFPAAC